eukprot:GILI01007230.1.p1 GENE.GILI01007230.1~~GILI01007230.1.p1  ORF type:complete len:544 (-),score=62.55 GILI01007230.1:215-1846(-)
MGCCASVVKVVPGDGSDYERQDVFLNPSEYDEDTLSNKAHMGEVTYSKADSDGVVANESSGMTGVRKKFIIAQAFVMHGINSDANQYTQEALKESPKLSRKETTKVIQWLDDIIQCALYQHIANNPKRSHVTLRGIASNAKFKNRTLIINIGESSESCGITEDSQNSAPEVISSKIAPVPRPGNLHLNVPVAEETRSASSNNSKIKGSKPTRRGSLSTDSNFSNRTGGQWLLDSPNQSPDERYRSAAFDARNAFAPNLSKVINMDGVLLALNHHCQAVQSARETGNSQAFMNASTKADDLAKIGLPSFRSVSDFSTTKLVDIRELCLKFNVQDDAGSRSAKVSSQNVTVDFTIGHLQVKDFDDDVSKHLNLLADRSESGVSPTSPHDKKGDSIRTIDHGGVASPVASPARRSGPAIDTPMNHTNPFGHFGSPTDSALSWKERTLTFDALKTFVKYQTFLLKQKKTEEVEFDNKIHGCPPTIRTLVFGPYPYSSSVLRPGLIPPTASTAAMANKSMITKNVNSISPQNTTQRHNESASDSDHEN